MSGEAVLTVAAGVETGVVNDAPAVDERMTWGIGVENGIIAKGGFVMLVRRVRLRDGGLDWGSLNDSDFQTVSRSIRMNH